jgi:CubicO group peptidase (beta-lactamase class C family)
MLVVNKERIHTVDADSLRLIRALHGYLPILMEKHQTPGLNIAVADKGRLVWEAAYGLADIARGVAMTPDNLFYSGSLAKTYVATAIMMLVDRGVLALADPINRYLPFEVLNPLGPCDITVRDLMTHTSGLSADNAASSWEPGHSLAEELAAEYAREWSPMYGGKAIKRWINPVGMAWVYSNLGVATLGLVVEVANPDGLSFSEFIQREIMDPLGMTHSCYPPAQHPRFVTPQLWSQTACGYSRMGGADIPTIPVYFHEYPAGGALSRPADHIRLLLAMMNEGELDGFRLLAPETAAAMLSPATEFGQLTSPLGHPIGEQGLIWRLLDRGQLWASFDHAGGHMFGWRTQGRAWPHCKAAVVVAANQWNLPEDTREAEEVGEFVGSWVRYRQVTELSNIAATQLSYVRGVLLAAAYRVVFGIEGAVSRETFETLTEQTRDRHGDWDAVAFRRGFEAVMALPATVQAVQQFWRSDKCEVAPGGVHAAFAALGGREVTGFLWDLLPERPAANEVVNATKQR